LLPHPTFHSPSKPLQLGAYQMAVVFITVYIPREKLGIKINDSIALQEIEMSRVPCVGEFIRYKGHDYKVTKVIHNLDFNSRNSLVTINPEAFIDVSLYDLQSPPSIKPWVLE
jgi:hypothetical protein